MLFSKERGFSKMDKDLPFVLKAFTCPNCKKHFHRSCPTTQKRILCPNCLAVLLPLRRGFIRKCKACRKIKARVLQEIEARRQARLLRKATS